MSARFAIWRPGVRSPYAPYFSGVNMPRREGAGRPKMDDPKANKVSMRLSNEELVRFEAYAKKHGLSKADTLRKAVEELIKRDK